MGPGYWHTSDSTFTLANLQTGSYVVAVFALDAQQVAKGQWADAYYSSVFVNVDSAITLELPTKATQGQAVTLSAQAIRITNPVYQFWVQLPSGTWISSAAYGSSTYTLIPAVAGTYKVAAFAKDPYAPSDGKYSVEVVQTFVVP